jgi:carbamoyl-phosphate synthase large subunit
MNVMLTCAGRRNYLVQFFQQALNGRGRVFAGDACGNALRWDKPTSPSSCRR